VSTAESEKIPSSVLVFLNRLSDLIFLWAREIHRAEGVPEEPWNPRGKD
jgi:cob(I)alamin adenosyltransferase